jgi:hypothetical protein
VFGCLDVFSIGDSDGWPCVGVLDVGAVLFGCCVEIMSCDVSVDYGGVVYPGCSLFSDSRVDCHGSVHRPPELRLRGRHQCHGA